MTMNKQEFIDKATDDFRNQITEASSLVDSVDDLKWAVFSTGGKEIEDKVLDTLVTNFMTNIEGVYIFRPSSPERCRQWLKEALVLLEKEYFMKTTAADHGYTIKTGD